MALVYVDRRNGLTIVHRDLYGKRSLIVHGEETDEGLQLLFSSCQVHSSGTKVVSFELPSNSTLVLDHASQEITLHRNETQPSKLRFNPEVTRGPITEAMITQLAHLLKASVSKRI